MSIIYIILLLVIAGFAKAAMDIMAFDSHWEKSIFNMKSKKYVPWLFWLSCFVTWEQWFYTVRESSKNKYFRRDDGTFRESAFTGSTDVLVWLTDGWHFFQMIMLTCLILVPIMYTPTLPYWLFDFIAMRLIFGISFSFAFSTLFKTKLK